MDGPVVWQSARTPAYEAAFERLRAAGRVFGCACTRKGDGRLGPRPGWHPALSGTCRDGLPAGRGRETWRLRVAPGVVSFDDAVQGRWRTWRPTWEISCCCGPTACLPTKLAVVVDDAEAGVTDVVRGADLLDSTPRQILLQRALAIPCRATPTCRWRAMPRARSSQSRPWPGRWDARPQQVLAGCAGFPGAGAPDGLVDASLDALWAWARANWSMDRVPASGSCRRRATAEGRRDTTRLAGVDGCTTLKEGRPGTGGAPVFARAGSHGLVGDASICRSPTGAASRVDRRCLERHRCGAGCRSSNARARTARPVGP